MIKEDLFLGKKCNLIESEEHTLYLGTCGHVLQNNVKHPALVKYPYAMDINTTLNGNPSTLTVMLTDNIAEDLEEGRKLIDVVYYVRANEYNIIDYIVAEGKLKISKI